MPSVTRLIIVLGAVNAIGPLSIDMYLPAFPEIARELRRQRVARPADADGVRRRARARAAADRAAQRPARPAHAADRGDDDLRRGLAPVRARRRACGVLIGLRFVQGLAGAGGVVIARAVVRDLHSGAAAVRLFSSLMLVTGLAPILAPLVGGQVLERDVVAGDLRRARGPVRRARRCSSRSPCAETLPPERRSDQGLAAHAADDARAAARPLVRRARARRRARRSARCSPTSRARRSSCRASTASRRSSTACCSR